MWYVVGAQRDDVGRRSLILTRQQIFVLLGYELCYGLRRIIEFGEYIFLSFSLRKPAIDKLFSQIVTEGLCRGQEHSTVAHGIALHIIEVSVRVGLVVIVQTVATQHLQQRPILHALIGDVCQVNARRVALELDIKPELGLLYVRGQIVHVLHHQLPVALIRIVRRVLQRLHEEGTLGIRQVIGKLTHLIGHATRGELIGHS